MSLNRREKRAAARAEKLGTLLKDSPKIATKDYSNLRGNFATTIEHWITRSRFKYIERCKRSIKKSNRRRKNRVNKRVFDNLILNGLVISSNIEHIQAFSLSIPHVLTKEFKETLYSWKF